MSFDVQVVFSGLVVVSAPIHATGMDDSIWGLLVKEPGHSHGGHDMPPHIPSVIYDRRDSGQSTVEDIRHQPLRPQMELEIEGKKDGGVQQMFKKIPGNVSRAYSGTYTSHGKGPGNVDWFVRGQVHADFAAQFALTKVARIDVCGCSWWDFGALGPTELATHVICTIEGYDKPELVVPVRGGTLELTPHDGKTLQVGFFNVPSDQLPGSGASFPPYPKAGDPPEHFSGYQRVFGLNPNQHPRFIDPQPPTVACVDCHRAGYRPDVGRAISATMAGARILQRTGIFPHSCLTLPGCPDDEPNC